MWMPQSQAVQLADDGELSAFLEGLDLATVRAARKSERRRSVSRGKEFKCETSGSNSERLMRMQNTAQIDVAIGEKPVPGEKFFITLQENSEMLGMLDHGRTFRLSRPPAQSVTTS